MAGPGGLEPPTNPNAKVQACGRLTFQTETRMCHRNFAPGVAQLADAPDSKFGGGQTVEWVFPHQVHGKIEERELEPKAGSNP